jgi:hypothetical protein
MYPWLWYWAPQLHFPFSGSVEQQIDPNAFFDAIPPAAGNGDIEKQVFDVASYGKQLGLITEVLLSLAGADAIDAKKAAESLERLKAVYRKIERVKADNKSSEVEAAIAMLDKLRASDPEQLDRVLKLYGARSDA